MNANSICKRKSNNFKYLLLHSTCMHTFRGHYNLRLQREATKQKRNIYHCNVHLERHMLLKYEHLQGKCVCVCVYARLD